MKIKKSKSKLIFDIFNYSILGLFVIAAMYPFIYQIALSFSSTSAIIAGDVKIVPVDFTLSTYEAIIETEKFWKQYANTIMYVVLGSAIALSMTTMCAYALSKKYLVGRIFLMKAITLTMFIAGGLIPYFYLIRQLGMLDTVWAIVIPGCIAPYNVILMRTFFMTLPSELEDAATIDGTSQLGYFFKIALPLSKPIIATITLFIAVAIWNEWFSALIYLNDDSLHPVTLYLRNVVMGSQLSSQTGANSGNIDGSSARSVPESTQAASLILVILPIMLLYPRIQKYFVKGVMIGAIKG